MTADFRTRLVVSLLFVVTVATSLLVVPGAGAAPARQPDRFRAACAPAHGHVVTCFATYRPRTSGLRVAAAQDEPQQLTPADIAAAYRLPASARPTGTVAIVDAYDNPNAEKDLAAYRARFHLPPCTTANGCFRKVNQRGKASPLPEPDAGWGVEISLDLDAVSAACPSCHILLVEGDSPDTDSLGAAVNTAVRLGAKAVSNSYGGAELGDAAATAKKYYTHPGVALVASSGDFGFVEPSIPATMPGVVAAGGTSLTKSTSAARGFTERAWQYAGSGCSGYFAKPLWQRENVHCSTRSIADVSAVADGDSGFIVRDTFGLGSDNGYLTVGGTSLSSPLVAAMIVRAGHAAQYSDARRIYAHRTGFFDITKGSNGFCGGDYLCTGKPGYDGPTGVGTPNGLGGL